MPIAVMLLTASRLESEIIALETVIARTPWAVQVSLIGRPTPSRIERGEYGAKIGQRVGLNRLLVTPPPLHAGKAQC
jgi:hypothetical protein